MANVEVGLRRGEYRDPLEVLISQESRTCAGCSHVAVVFNSAYCGLGKRYGKRCKSYSEAEVVRG